MRLFAVGLAYMPPESKQAHRHMCLTIAQGPAGYPSERDPGHGALCINNPDSKRSPAVPEHERGSQGLKDGPEPQTHDFLGKICGVSSDMQALKIAGKQTTNPHTPSRSNANSRTQSSIPEFGENDHELDLRCAKN